MTYRTKQRDLIVDVLKGKDKEFTIKEIYEEVKDSVGLTTVYRLVDNLVKEGIISRSINNDNVTLYSYLGICDNENHFYLKCDKCGSMIHIDCDCINDLSNHINKEHKFCLRKENVIINGICDKCRKDN